MPSGCYNTTGGLESKADEIRKSVMSNIRELVRLNMAFKSQSPDLTTEDMFSRKHKETPFAAIEAITEKNQMAIKSMA